MPRASALRKAFAAILAGGVDQLNDAMLGAAGAGYGCVDAGGQWATIRRALDGGADINAQNGDGDTVLSLLCAERHTQSALNLIAAGADVNLAGKLGMTPLLWAALSGDAAVLRALIAKGADVNATDGSGRNAAQVLLHSVPPRMMRRNPEQHRADRTEALGVLFAAGSPVTEEQLKEIYHSQRHLAPGIPPVAGALSLRAAMESGSADAVKAVLDGGVHPDAPAAYGDHSALSLAAARGNIDIMSLALKAGADVEKRAGGGGYTALQSAALNGREEAFDFLVAAGAGFETPAGTPSLPDLAVQSAKPGMPAFVADRMKHLYAEGVVMQRDVAVPKTLKFRR